MHRAFLLPVVLALTLAAAAHGQLPRELAGSASLELHGDGRVAIAARGGVLGRFDRGRVVIRDVKDKSGTEIHVSGADWSRKIDKRARMYGGKDVRFRALGGKWRVRISAKGIDASAAGRGSVSLKGTGKFSLDGGEARRWPSTLKTYTFGD